MGVVIATIPKNPSTGLVDRVVSTITYDSADRTQTYTERGETYTYNYNYGDDFAVTAKTDSANNRWQYRFVPSGQITNVTPPPDSGGGTHTDYNPDGTTQIFTDGAGVRTIFTYNGNGPSRRSNAFRCGYPPMTMATCPTFVSRFFRCPVFSQ